VSNTSKDPEAAGERRHVAILFADLSGFTELSARLDAEDLRHLVEDFYSQADAVVARYGGRVDKQIGDAIMALFGAPVAHGDDSLRAVGAALDIIAVAGGITEPSGDPLAVHVGIAMGEVVAGGIGRGYTVLGDAVNLASRLVGLAGPGEAVIDEGLLLQLEGRIRTTALPPTRLKGITQPVVGWRVEGLESLRHPTGPFIGRETDRRLLTGLLDACRSNGRGRVVVVRGEAGIGKSRLIEETLAEAAQKGFATHKALVLDFGTGKGLDARGMLTRSLLRLAPDSGEAARRRAMESAAAENIFQPEERGSLLDLLDLPPEGEDRALLQAMEESTRQIRRRALLAALLTRLARSRPIVAAIEDLQWADPLLLEDLGGLGSATAEAPVLLLLSTRPEGDRLDRLAGSARACGDQYHRTRTIVAGGIGAAGGCTQGARGSTHRRLHRARCRESLFPGAAPSPQWRDGDRSRASLGAQPGAEPSRSPARGGEEGAAGGLRARTAPAGRRAAPSSATIRV